MVTIRTETTGIKAVHLYMRYSTAEPDTDSKKLFILKNAVGHRVHRAHRGMLQEITHKHPRLAAEFKFVDHHTISIFPCTPSSLCGLCDEIDLRNLGSIR